MLFSQNIAQVVFLYKENKAYVTICLHTTKGVKMDLFEWLRRNKITGKQLAKKIGIKNTYLYNVYGGYFIPSHKVAYNIYKATDGEVCIKFNRHSTSVETMNEAFAKEFEEKNKDD